MSDLGVHLRTREFDGVQVSSHVRITPYHFGKGVFGDASPTHVAELLSGVALARLARHDTEGSDHYVNALNIGEQIALFATNQASIPGQAGRVIQWLRTVADAAEAKAREIEEGRDDRA